jgi:hypothetical protein
MKCNVMGEQPLGNLLTISFNKLNHFANCPVFFLSTFYFFLTIGLTTRGMPRVLFMRSSIAWLVFVHFPLASSSPWRLRQWMLGSNFVTDIVEMCECSPTVWIWWGLSGDGNVQWWSVHCFIYLIKQVFFGCIAIDEGICNPRNKFGFTLKWSTHSPM